MSSRSRKLEQRIIKFHYEFPDRCICWLLDGECIGWDESGKTYCHDISYYTKPCEKCGYKKYDGPTYDYVSFAQCCS